MRLILACLSLLLFATSGKPVSDKKEAAAFRNPDVSFRPMPFWHLNGHLQRDTIVRQMTDAARCGFGGVTILPVSPGPQHPTGKPCPGMTPPYLTDEYFDRYTDMLETSRKLGTKLIIYDDVDFPSGSAGGRLRSEYPQYVRKTIEKEESLIAGPAAFSKALPASDDLKCMAVSAMNVATKQVVDLTDAVKDGVLSWNVPQGQWRIMLFNCRCNTHSLVDYMQPEAVEKVISMTYDEYGKRYGKYFGNVVDKVFYDDVGYVAMERTWTPAITDIFERKYGRSAALYYPALFYDIGPETAAARVAFYDIRAELMAEGYTRQVAEWCGRHGLKSMGHPPGNYCTNSTDMHGDILKFYRHSQIPLTDYIFFYGHGRDGFKQVSSAADLYDRPVVGAEVCGAFSADMDSLMLYRVALDLFARGVNFLVPHGMWYDPSPDHVRIPPLISPYSALLAPTLNKYNDFSARCCRMLQGGRRISDIALVYPIASTQAGFEFDAPGEWGEKYPSEVDYHEIGRLLTTVLRRDFTLVHPEFLADGKIRREGAEMVLDNAENRQRYAVLVLPGGKVFSADAMARIREFYENGGAVLATTALPEKSAEFGRDGELARDVDAVFGPAGERAAGVVRKSASGGRSVFVAVPEAGSLRQALAALGAAPDVEFGDDSERNSVSGPSNYVSRMVASEDHESAAAPPLEKVGGSFCYIHKQRDGRDIYFFSNSTDDRFSTPVFVRGERRLQSWNPYTGEIEDIASRTVERHGVAYTEFDLSMEPVSGTFVVGR